MTKKEKKGLVKLLDRYQIKSLFYSEICVRGGWYHIIRVDDEVGHWVEDKIEGELEDE